MYGIYKSLILYEDYIILICTTLLFITLTNKIFKSDWLSTVLISALIGQCNRTVCVMPKLLDSMYMYHHMHTWFFHF